MHVPGWHDATRELQRQGKLRMAGIVQEQHPDRARLFMQWKQMDWPILIDSLDLLDVSVVPLTFAIDEQGVIRHVNPARESIESTFADVTYAAPPGGRRPLPVRAPRIAEIERERATLAPGDLARYGHARFLWAPELGMEDVLAAYDETLNTDPLDARTHFRRGVALRARYDSPARRPGDFAAAVESWQRALDLDPNQYIWRRRIQQYGPRLDKPYPFYDWVAEARAAITARGETPAALVAEPGGAELAQPARTFEPVADDATDPDPRGRIRRDDGDFIRIESVLVPPSVAPGDALRVHLELYPIAAKRAHWNNEVDDLLVWLEPTAGFTADRRRLSTPNPAAEVSNEVRRVELEVHAGEDVESPGRFRGYALYYVCEDVDGTCLYRRQDIDMEIPIRK